MKYCSICGDKVELKIPENDHLPRYCCEGCGEIHYQNPKIVTGTIPIMKGKILLCKRAIDPRQGRWTLPAGFLENRETIEQGAFRETLEETNTKVKMGSLYAIFNIPQVSQIYILFFAEVLREDFGKTSESLEVKLFKEDEIPWKELAFPFVPIILKYYFEDRKNNKFDRGIFRMFVDRVFTKKGFGTVVTGTVLSGSISKGKHLQILPNLEEVNIRGIHSHDSSVDKLTIDLMAPSQMAI